jgi:glycosyltransferase involved in cell wall biosynthesis
MSNDNPPEKRPKVSVAMITYNHEQFVEQAVRSVMMQETDFDYELIIGEDCSTDNTREIVVRLKEEFPDKIRLILHEQNVGVGRNIVITCGKCNGEYVALIEGDDYWTSKNKLTTQIKIMEENRDCVLSFHGVNIYDETTQSLVGQDGLGQTGIKYSQQDLASKTIYPRTASTVFRRSCLNLPSWVNSLTYVDIALFLICASSGSLIFVDQPMAVYRRHSAGVWSGPETDIRNFNAIQTYETLNRHFEFRFASQFALRKRYLQWSREQFYAKHKFQARKTFLKALRHPNGGGIYITEVLKTFLLLYVPKIQLLKRLVNKN